MFPSVIRGSVYPIAIATEKLITFWHERMVNILKAVICSPPAINVTTEINPAKGGVV